MMDKLRHELRLIYSTKEQSQNGKRLMGLDMARGIAIILVVIGHSGFISHNCNIWISSFHLPLFFIISGILAGIRQEEEQSLSKLALQKARSIMIPYLWFSIGSVCLDILQVLVGNFKWSTVWEHVTQTLTLQGYSVLWFLPVLYLAEMLLLLLNKTFRSFLPKGYIRSLTGMIVITICAVGGYYIYQALIVTSVPAPVLHIFLILGKSFIGAAFMSYGYVCGHLYTNGATTIRKWHTFLSGILLSSVNFMVLSQIHLMDLNNLDLQNLGMYLLLGTTGGIGCILLCMSIPNIPLLTFYGQNSLIIMCTHLNFYVMLFSMRFYEFLFPGVSGTNVTMYAVFSLVGTFVLSIAVILIIKIFFPFVLGRKIICFNNKQEKTIAG